MSVSFIDTTHLHNVSIFDTYADMEPAKHIVFALGGPSEVSRVVGVHRTRVSNWMRSKEKGGTGGLIPLKYVAQLLAFAKRKGVELSADDFIPVQEAAE